LTDLVARAPFIRRNVVQSGASNSAQVIKWGIAVESPVEVALNGTPWTVMLATPANVEDLAIGVALTERVLRDASAVTDVHVSEFLHDISVNLVVPPDALDSTALRSRSLLSSTACGLCGIESLAELTRQNSSRAERAEGPLAVSDVAIFAAFASLLDHQPVNRATHSVHAAAWCTPTGVIALAREDVGRHNALDKLIGAMAARHMLADDGFIVMSSRCSYELVYKAALTHCRMLATISAPTTMALEWSHALSLPLACCSREGIVRFSTDNTNV
jgi:FdhD protein